MFNRHLKEKINCFEKVSIGFNLFKEDKNKQRNKKTRPEIGSIDYETRQGNPLCDKLWMETFLGCLF